MQAGIRFIALITFYFSCMSIAFSQEQAKFLSDFHAEKNLECSSCHVNDATTNTPNMTKVESQTCLSCHDDYFDKTIDDWPNAHASPHMKPDEVLVCTDCHFGHKKQVATCSACHEDFKFDLKY